MSRPEVNFVVRSLAGCEAALAASSIDAALAADPALRTAISSQGDMCWCALTYFRLREAGVQGIRLSERIDPACINVVHTLQLKPMPVPRDAFVVCVRADMDRRIWAHYHLVQNRDHEADDTTCIYLWPQPALVGRADPPEAVRKVAFLGQPYNGNLVMHPRELAALLEEHGFEFAAPSADWNDFSEVDASIGIRSFDSQRHSSKPPSKLINAWLAGVPFIGGSDSAYAQVGTDGEDYLVATSREQLVAQLVRLRDDPALRLAMIDRGKAKAQLYSNAALARQWQDVLDGPVAARFARWRANPGAERRRLELLVLLDRVVAAVRSGGSRLRNALLNARYD